jgi:hypothetical protein
MHECIYESVLRLGVYVWGCMTGLCVHECAWCVCMIRDGWKCINVLCGYVSVLCVYGVWVGANVWLCCVCVWHMCMECEWVKCTHSLYVNLWIVYGVHMRMIIVCVHMCAWVCVCWGSFQIQRGAALEGLCHRLSKPDSGSDWSLFLNCWDQETFCPSGTSDHGERRC